LGSSPKIALFVKVILLAYNRAAPFKGADGYMKTDPNKIIKQDNKSPAYTSALTIDTSRDTWAQVVSLSKLYLVVQLERLPIKGGNSV